MSLKQIRLEFARTPDFPGVSARHGYEIASPWDCTGQPDPAAWALATTACTVRRFWDKADDEHGTLIHRRDGKWAFSYKPGDDDDEPIFRFDKYVFVVGEYVSVTEHDRVARPFRVVEIHSAPAAAAPQKVN